jgi:hypothetical protein
MRIDQQSSTWIHEYFLRIVSFFLLFDRLVSAFIVRVELFVDLIINIVFLHAE